MDALPLSLDQKLVLNALPDMPTYGRCIFITGAAGTGKSTILRQIAASTPMRLAVLAPTGIAAINAGGQTIHSFFGLPLGPLDDPELIPIFKKGGPKRRLIEKLDALIIDEISMVRADIMDAIDISLRANRRIDEPFGGVTVFAFGDLWQLEPVVAGPAEQQMLEHHYASPFFFDSRVVRDTSLDIHELTTVHRQADDPEFLWALSRLRRGVTAELDYFNDRVGGEITGGSFLTLTATNSRSQAINLQALTRLTSPTKVFEGKAEGDFGRDLPTDSHLQLKIGAQVMFIKNGREWVNGTLGHVCGFDEESVKVQLEDGRVVDVRPEVWEKSRYSWDSHSNRILSQAVGSFTQIPLKLAWAATIHKAQGLTFDRVRVDMDRAGFAHGQCYVAMSRCRTHLGMSLVRPIKESDVIVHARVAEFDRQLGHS